MYHVCLAALCKPAIVLKLKRSLRASGSQYTSCKTRDVSDSVMYLQKEAAVWPAEMQQSINEHRSLEPAVQLFLCNTVTDDVNIAKVA